MEKLLDALSSPPETMAMSLQHAYSEIESRRRDLVEERESAAERVAEIEGVRKSLEKRLRDVDERENELDLVGERKKRKLGLIVRDDDDEEELVAVKKRIDWVEFAQSEIRGIRDRVCEKLKEVEARERNLELDRESLAAKERKVDLVIESLEERIRVVDKRENEFNLFLDGKMRDLVLKEEALRLKGEELVKEVKLVEEKCREQDELRESLEFADYKLQAVKVAIEKFKEIELKENASRELMDKQLEEFEKMKTELNLFQDEKMREFELKERELSVMSEELVKDARLREERLAESEKRGLDLLKRLEFAQCSVEGLKMMVDERVKENSRREIELNSIRDWVEAKMDEADCKAKELKEREKGIKEKEDKVVRKENELRRKKHELDLKENELLIKKKEIDLKEKNLESSQKELDIKHKEVDSAQELNERRSFDLHWREKSLSSLKEFTRICFKDHTASKRQLRTATDLVEKRARDLDRREQELDHRERELESKGKEHQIWSIAHPEIEHDSPDLNFVVKMDGKTLQTHLNDPKKDLDSMGGEICTVIRLSSNPAKLVLDAMEGFYPPYLREEDVEVDVRRTCIVLLEQLFKISPEIKPRVKDEALKLANEWKSKMDATAQNSLEVLGFVHLVAAYNLVSCFDRDEILRALMMVAEHTQTCELCRFLLSQRELQILPS